MKEIVKVLLQEGIDEETIHEVLNVINELDSETLRSARNKRLEQHEETIKKLDAKALRALKKGDEDTVDTIDQQKDELDAKLDDKMGMYQRALKRNMDKKKAALKAKMKVEK